MYHSMNEKEKEKKNLEINGQTTEERRAGAGSG